MKNIEIKIDYNFENKADLLVFSGEIDSSNLNDVKSILDEFLNKTKQQKVIFELENLNYLNSETIGYLLEFNTILQQNNKKLILVNAKDNVKDILRVIGFLNAVSYYDSLNSVV